eukprot:1001776-Pelagomonas_calceolata.AAC.1
MEQVSCSAEEPPELLTPEVAIFKTPQLELDKAALAQEHKSKTHKERNWIRQLRHSEALRGLIVPHMNADATALIEFCLCTHELDRQNSQVPGFCTFGAAAARLQFLVVLLQTQSLHHHVHTIPALATLCARLPHS